VNALDKCGLTEGDALSRKRRRYERLGSTRETFIPLRQKGKAARRAPCGSRKRVSRAPVDQKDPLTKLRVVKEMKKSRSARKGKSPEGKGKGKHARTDSTSTKDHSITDVEDEVFEDDDERMDLSDIEWYTRQTFEDEPHTPVTKRAVLDEEDEEADDLDMSEVELDVLASPMIISPSPKRLQRSTFQVPANPVTSIPELNSVPCCLYRPTADIIEEVYTHLGLDKSDQRGIRNLKDLLDQSSTITKPKSSRYELGSSGIFANRPTAAKDWMALSLTRKIIRRDRLAKSAIYRFTFRYSKEDVPARFLRWQTWNHPTLAEIKLGLRFKLDERVEETSEVDEEESQVPSSPAMVESELDDDLDDVPEIDDILSIASELDLDDHASTVDMNQDERSEMAQDEDDAELTETEDEIDEGADEDERLYQALGLGLSGVPEYESPGAPLASPSPRRAPVYSRISRSVSDDPPTYAPRNYRDQSPTPPPPFNAQTDNDVVVLPRFSPLAAVAALPQLLPAFEMNLLSRRVISPLPTPRRSRTSRAQRRVVSGEIVIPGAFASRQTPPTPTPAARVSRASAEDAFQHALDMEEAETALDFFESESQSPQAAQSGVIGWGTSLVRSWWRR
jgi:hypothetical protein